MILCTAHTSSIASQQKKDIYPWKEDLAKFAAGLAPLRTAEIGREAAREQEESQWFERIGDESEGEDRVKLT